MASERWIVPAEEQKKYMDSLTENLKTLRAKASISQEELCNMLGISRQTFSAIETGRRKMNWSYFLVLILFFDTNLDTRDFLRSLPAYPEDFFLRLNEGKKTDDELFGSNGLPAIIKELDDAAVHAIKTLILVEYARCRKVPNDAVIRAFDGMQVPGGFVDAAVEDALKKIRERANG